MSTTHETQQRSLDSSTPNGRGTYRTLTRLNCIGYDPEPFEARINEGERVTITRSDDGGGFWLEPDDAEAVYWDGPIAGLIYPDEDWVADQEAA